MNARDDGADLARRTRRAQGLPERVADPVAIAEIAALLTASQPTTTRRGVPSREEHRNVA